MKNKNYKVSFGKKEIRYKCSVCEGIVRVGKWWSSVKSCSDCVKSAGLELQKALPTNL